MNDIDIQHLKSWVGRCETRQDIITPALVERFKATIPDLLWDGVEVPLGIHWCLALSAAPLVELGPDGHAARGGFLPPVPLPSRMWAGGEAIHHAAFRVGDEVSRVSRISDVTAKTGRSGLLVFVAVEHEYLVRGDTVVSERQDLVYREPSPAPMPVPAPVPALVPAGEPAASGEGWMRTGPVQMFRYSALTFNGHRIHYDGDYARGEEGYPGLVVHGPLQATLLINLAARTTRSVPRHFSFRGLRPLFAGEAYRFGQNGGEVWVEKAEGVTMKGNYAS